MATGQPEKRCQGNIFPATQSASTFHTFSYTQQSETKII